MFRFAHRSRAARPVRAGSGSALFSLASSSLGVPSADPTMDAATRRELTHRAADPYRYLAR